MAKDKKPPVKRGLPARRGKTDPAIIDYGEDVGAGFEGTTSRDYAIPFIAILQNGSPQVAAKIAKAAVPGAVYNTVTNELWAGEEGVPFIPAMRDHCFVEWVPRDKGGGFVARHGLDSDVVVHAKETGEFGEYKTSSGNDLVETQYVYGVLPLVDGPTMAVVAFTSTKIKKYRAMMTKARSVQITLPDGRRINPPLYAHRFLMRTVLEANVHGQFYNWDIRWDGENAAACRLSPDDEVYQLAKACRDMVISGAAGADYQRQNVAGGNGGDKDIPF